MKILLGGGWLEKFNYWYGTFQKGKPISYLRGNLK